MGRPKKAGFDAADYLDSEETIAAYINAALETVYTTVYTKENFRYYCIAR